MKKKKNRKTKSLKLIPDKSVVQNDAQNKIKKINDFCEHLKKGYSEKSFQNCDYLMIESYADEIDCINKNEEQINKIKNAMRASLNYWETKAIELMDGKINKLNIQLWMFVMKCRFGWAPVKNENNNTTEKVVEVQLKLSNEWV